MDTPHLQMRGGRWFYRRPIMRRGVAGICNLNEGGRSKNGGGGGGVTKKKNFNF